jgi:hypothetical protein
MLYQDVIDTVYSGFANASALADHQSFNHLPFAKAAPEATVVHLKFKRLKEFWGTSFSGVIR